MRMHLGRGAQTYLMAVFVAGMLLVALLLPSVDREWIRGILFFLVLALLAEAVPVTLPRGFSTVSVSIAIFFASTIVYGPGVGAIVGAFGTIRPRDLRGQVPLQVVLFNRGQLALAAGLGGLAYVGLGGVPGQLAFPGSLLPLGGCALVCFLINVITVTLGLSLVQRVSPRGLWRVNFRGVIPHYLALTPVGVLVAYVYIELGWVSVLLFFFPLLVARYAFQRYMDMRNTYLSTIRALTAALEAKDPHTRGHAARVAQIAVLTGRQMSLPEDELELLEYVGLLHDIGKIAVPDAVLKKPGIFTEDEYLEMQHHPVIGAEIVRGIRMLGKGSSWIRYHHERWDGRGFPEGLKGDQIPLGARIIAAADAFDAMISDRPYKQALTVTEAKEEMRRASGTQFDPEVARALLRAIENVSFEGAAGNAQPPGGRTQ